MMLNNTYRLIFLLIAFFSTQTDYAQIGTNDSTFNVADSGNGFGDGFNDLVNTSGFQTDGKIIIGGRFTSYNNVPTNRIIRVNDEGQVDTSFHLGLGFNNDVGNITVQQDGKIIIGGSFSSYNGYGYGRIVRLNEDGSVDTSFHSGTGFNAFVTDVIIQNDGKILVSGSFVSYNGTACNRIVRLNSDGTLDNTFSADNVLFNGNIDEIKLQPDGRILMIGNFNGKLARLNPDGSVDPTFSIGSGPGPANTTTITELALQSDGKILICGNFTNYNGTSVNRVVRLNSDGTIDNSFNIGTGANGSNLILFNLTVQTDGKIFLTGSFSSFNGIAVPKIVRLNPDGSVDNSFQIIVNADYTYNCVEIQPDGKLIIGFDWTANPGYYRSMDRFNADGSIDPTFNRCTGFNGPVYSSALQSDGKIVVGGYFTSYNGVIANRIVRMNGDGTLDNTFNSGLGANNGVHEIVIQPDGKILIGGRFTSYNGIAANMIVRLNPDGTLDNTFNSVSDEQGLLEAIALQPDGKILVGGSFGWYLGFAYSSLVRLFPDGTIDASFDHNISGDVADVLVESDGQIIVVGNDILKRLNTDGSTDFTFNTGSGPNSTISTCVQQADGKLIIGGFFTSYNGAACNYLTRLDTNGVIDNTFLSGLPNGPVRACGVQADGKILIGGSFSTYGFATALRFARINADGSYDFDFPQYFIGNGTVETLLIQADGKAVIGGNFVSWYSMGRNRITRIKLCAPTTTTIDQTACNSFSWLDNQILSSSGTYVDTVLSVLGCDSIVTLNLTIVPSQPLSVDIFSQPSDANSCVGTASISTVGEPDFTETIDGGSPITHSGYTLVENLCPGIHSLFTTNGCGDTLTTTFIIPVDSNYIFNNPFIDSIAVDSLGATVEDCDIYYNGIDTAFIDSIFANGNTVTVIWNIVDSNGSNFDTSSYVLNNGNGVYYLQLSVFCPTKSIGDYFAVTEAIYFEDGDISTADLTALDHDHFDLFPNPTNDVVTIRFEFPRADLVVYDTQGKRILTNSINSGEVISLVNVESGIYFFELTTNQGKTTQRVVKQ